MLKISRNHVKAGVSGEYIGRAIGGRKGSPLGNPFTVKKYGRRTCMVLYKLWLYNKVCAGDKTVMAELHRLLDIARSDKGLVMLCWCSDEQGCHGDIIKDTLVDIDNVCRRHDDTR